MNKKNKKKDIYSIYRSGLFVAILATIIISGISFMLMYDKVLCAKICCIIGMFILGTWFVMSFAITAGEYDRKSIRIIELNFADIGEGMSQLNHIYPNIYNGFNYINTYVYNKADGCFYSIYKKDEIHWMHNIGKNDPKEKYMYGY